MPNLSRVISNRRLNPYRQNATDTECLKSYVWNILLSESLYPSLQCLEVALRNSIHEATKTYFNNDFWFDDNNIISQQRTQNIISRAKDKLREENKPITSDAIVAELSFGFWRHLFYTRYEHVLWRIVVNDVFPNAPRSMRSRASIGPRIHRAQQLRNRIFHHEAIWHWQDLEQQHREMIETIQWLSHPLYDLHQLTDRFPQVFNQDLSQYETVLDSLQI